ncbi:MAG TPA: L,D-transpeptidase [Tepidisphaeraceae bacterium]|nr:L,D-transpeptidase [Tepidisphaeraceae bacterium]
MREVAMDGRRRGIAWIAMCLLGMSAGVYGAAPVADADRLRTGFAWQIALEHAGFSPGLVDGKIGPRTALSTREFQRAHGLPVTGKLDDATSAQLALPAVVTATYTITDEDQQVVTGTPKDWNEKAAMHYLGYASLIEVVGEKYHTSRKCIEGLNPGVNMDRLKVGDSLTVPAVDEPTDLGRLARLEINLVEKTIRGYDKSNQEIALFYCSIAKDVSKRPTGSARVVVVTPNPAYSFDPKMWPDVHDVTHKLLIPPGPRNPVGMCWVGLSLPGYGIHGTPAPEMIGKTGSHGCFRLTNWDAVRLGRITTPGIPVKFINPGSDVAAADAPVAAVVTKSDAAAAPAASSGSIKNVPWDQLLMGAMATTQPSEHVAVGDAR